MKDLKLFMGFRHFTHFHTFEGFPIKFVVVVVELNSLKCFE